MAFKPGQPEAEVFADIDARGLHTILDDRTASEWIFLLSLSVNNSPGCRPYSPHLGSPAFLAVSVSNLPVT